MQADTMVDRRAWGRAIATTTRSGPPGVSIGRIAEICVAFLIPAILVLGFVAMSLGLGTDGPGGPGGVGPDRPPPPAAIS